MVEDALALEAAGADILLVECVPNEVGKAVTDNVAAPVIGIGACPDVDGQILVLYDMLGITQGVLPRFVQNFMMDSASARVSCGRCVQAVRDRSFPSEEDWFS